MDIGSLTHSFTTKTTVTYKCITRHRRRTISGDCDGMDGFSSVAGALMVELVSISSGSSPDEGTGGGVVREGEGTRGGATGRTVQLV